ncbi:MAG TPA: sugar transferase, partial [Acidimicrobiales bacterium]|nr:sugar transferase [Acidimicrobiales bacterium]
MIAGEERRGRAAVSARPAAPVAVEAPPDRRRRAATRNPAWLRAADACQRSLRQPLPVALDLVIVAAATFVASGLSGSSALVGAAVVLVTGLLLGVWKRRSSVQAQGVGWYLRRVAPCTVLIAAVLVLYPGLDDRVAILCAVACFTVLAAAKLALWVLVATARRRGLGLKRTLVIGPERQVGGTEYRIHLYPEAGLVCAHSHVCSPVRKGTPDESLALVERLVNDHEVDHVVCTGGDSDSDSVMRDIVRLAPPTVDVTVVQQVPLAGVPSTRLGDLGVICLARPSWGTELAKRTFDVLVASLLLLVLCPVMLITAVAIRAGDPGPALFRQRRTGRFNRMFTIYKFRSMVADAESRKLDLLDQNVADGLLFKAVNDPRITRVGSFIRRFSIDELPQLVNVIAGNMSLVGPRPLPS